jgi:hypothetical protein
MCVVVGGHKGHDVSTLHDAALQVRPDIQPYNDKALHLEEQLQERKRELQDNLAGGLSFIILILQ